MDLAPETFDGSLITRPDKLFFPQKAITKSDVAAYYMLVGKYILPWLDGRPLVMKRYPDGIDGKSFYQKEIPEYAPEWLRSVTVCHRHAGKEVNYAVVTDQKSLLWLINQGCIEIHAWLSKAGSIDCPDIIVFDLDPEPPAAFKNCLEVALIIRQVLQELEMDAWPKTSGATGMHLFVPVTPNCSFKETTLAARKISRAVLEAVPDRVTLEHKISSRTGKVYLDYLQNARGRTMVFPYSLRPIAEAPVSAPLSWEEVALGNIVPSQFNIYSVWPRLQQKGDLMAGFFARRYDLKRLLTIR